MTRILSLAVVVASLSLVSCASTKKSDCSSCTAPAKKECCAAAGKKECCDAKKK
jgi:hypothetical protein